MLDNYDKSDRLDKHRADLPIKINKHKLNEKSFLSLFAILTVTVCHVTESNDC